MKKTKFLKLLKCPESIQEKELHSLIEMAKEHPYSQAIHILIAKASHTLSFTEYEKKINHAAVYTADRKNLKHLIENTIIPLQDNTTSHNPDVFLNKSEKSKNEKQKIENFLEKLRREKLALQFQSETGVSEDIIEERQNFIDDIDAKIIEAEAKLAKLRLTDLPGTIEETPEFNKDLDEESPEKKEDLYNELRNNLRSLKAHRELGVENKEQPEEQSLEPKDTKEEKQDSEPITTLSNHVEKERMAEYLASLKSREEEIISNEKLKEQIKIINQFIENEPKLSRLEREDTQSDKREDLSLKSLKVHHNIASENLALIMAKQGKLEKAEEIYNKLIWKFPEKKAYFVAQIEDLKKK